jgi:hypothetical protein
MEVEYNNLVKTKIYKLSSVNGFKNQNSLVTRIISKINFAYFSHHLNVGIRITQAVSLVLKLILQHVTYSGCSS